MKVNETILNDLQALSKKEFMTKYQIPKSTYYYWKKKYGSNTTANKIKNEEHKDEEISEGIVENTQPIQNEEIIDLDLGENVENKVNNDVDLVAT
ncbi:MAG: hypothetical protein N2053_13375, partial [Chitinispirillaceae bacterium]|nr:hypothetical protein [Chitinispirillaceae bacterium]